MQSRRSSDTMNFHQAVQPNVHNASENANGPDSPEFDRSNQYLGQNPAFTNNGAPKLLSALRPLSTSDYNEGVTPISPVLLPIIVLAISLAGEFITANVSMPFIVPYVMKLKVAPEGDNAAIAFYCGLLSSMFFLSQLFASMFWSYLAVKFGKRSVLVVSLLGSTISTAAFGQCSSFIEAVCVRLLQGMFAGAVGVSRTVISDISDSTNQSRVYSILSFAFMMGGVVGAVIGGYLESPAERIPYIFKDWSIFEDLPYLLPCLAAASITGAGSILAMFLNYDALPRDKRVILSKSLIISAEDGLRQNNFKRTGHISPGALSNTNSPKRMRNNVNTEHPDEVLTSNAMKRESIMSLSKRLVLSQEDAIYSLTDLWVGAAKSNEAGISREGQDAEEMVDEEENSDRIGESVETLSHLEVREPREDLPTEFLTLNRPISRVSLDLRNSRRPEQVNIRPRRDSIFSNSGLNHLSGRESQISESLDQTKSTSVLSSLPLTIIFQYGLLAFHGVTFDQIFLSLCFFKHEDGGLALQPSQFSQLIGLMAFASLIHQFIIYPKISPPRGELNHIQLFRLGSLIYVFSYFLTPYLRKFYEEGSSDFDVLMAMTILSAIRFLGQIICYTSITILINISAPPHLLGFANGLAQSTVALCRWAGPLFGGWLWQTNTEYDAASGVFHCFNILTALAIFAIIHSYTIR